MSRQSDFVTLARQETRNLWNAWLELKSMQEEWNALDYANTLGDEDDAFAGENEGLSASEVGAVIFDTANAIDTEVMDAGHATNMAKLL